MSPYHIGHLIAEFTVVKKFVIHRLPSHPLAHFHQVKSHIVLAVNMPSRRKATRHRANSHFHLVRIVPRQFRLVILLAGRSIRRAVMTVPPSVIWDLVLRVVFS